MHISCLFIVALALTSACSAAPQIAVQGAGAGEVGPSTMPASIRGVVRNEHGWELAGIVVMAVSAEGSASRAGYTDLYGVYSIGELAPGMYTLHVQRGNQVVLERRVQLTATTHDMPLRVPAAFGDRPDQRGRPIVDRSLLR